MTNEQILTTQRDGCDPDRLDAFLAGDLDDHQVSLLEGHLDTCPECETELQRRTAEPSFWADAQQFLSSTTNVQGQDNSEPAIRLPETEEPNCQTLSFLDPTDDPDKLGRFAGYEISGVIGSGGMGIVMKGWDVSLDRFVAIKVLHSNYAGQSASRKRFAREAQAAAAVLHDNVIAIYGVDHWKGMPYLVMPYIKGESLQHRIDRSAPLPLENVLEISLQIARGLAAAHDQGLVHRDIKPANILMPASVSRVIITDFGLARTVDDANLTRSGVLAGTPQYMSPEQAKGEAVDGRADLFSLGSVIYTMVCGRPPFRADSPYAVLQKITNQPHRPLHCVRAETPVWFERIVDRLLAKNPKDRFHSADELANVLEDCLAHLRQPLTTELPKLEAPRDSRRRWHHACLAIAALAAIGVISVAIWAFLRPRHQPDDGAPSQLSTSPDSGSLEPHLAWEFDTSRLDRLETDLQILLQDTAVEPINE